MITSFLLRVEVLVTPLEMGEPVALEEELLEASPMLVVEMPPMEVEAVEEPGEAPVEPTVVVEEPKRGPEAPVEPMVEMVALMGPLDKQEPPPQPSLAPFLLYPPFLT